jgi:hypothetical protein
MRNFVTKMICLAAFLLFAADIMAQVPQGFNFQAVARDASGEIIADTELGVRVTVLQGAEDGTAVYTEVQSPTTSAVGSFQIVIGEGTSEDDFGTIDWSADNYYVKLEVDPAGGDSYEELGTTRLLSVPYALLAQDVVNGSGSGNGGPITLTGSNGNMNVNISNTGVDNNYGLIQLGDDTGEPLATLEIPHDSTGSVGFGRLRLNHKNGNNVRLFPNNLYFDNSNIETAAPLGWFGTIGGNSGFSQLLSYNAETSEYQGGILTGHWPGMPTILMEDGSETPLVILEGQNHEDRNIGVLTLRGTDGSEFSITSDGIDGGSANGQTLDSLFFATSPDAEFQRNSFYFPGYQRFEDQDGNYSTFYRTGLQYGNYADEGVFNWFSKGSMQVAHSDYANGERATGMNPGYFYMDIFKNGSFYAPLQMGISNDSAGGRPYFSMSSLTRKENEEGDLFSINVAQDPNGNDPNGESSELFMWGDTSPNIQMGGQQWENTDHAYLQMFGSTQDGNGWYMSNAFMGVASDGTDEWASLSLMKTNIAGQSTEETILLDGFSGNITISGSLTQNSDERLKKDILTIENALEKTNQLRGVSYTWKTDKQNENPQIGVIAQKVEKVFPEFVHTDEDGMKSVNYAQMTAVLIEAVKELNSQIQDLQKENASLQAQADKQTELENRLAKIEKLLGQNNSASATANTIGEMSKK